MRFEFKGLRGDICLRPYLGCLRSLIIPKVIKNGVIINRGLQRLCGGEGRGGGYGKCRLTVHKFGRAIGEKRNPASGRIMREGRGIELHSTGSGHVIGRKHIVFDLACFLICSQGRRVTWVACLITGCVDDPRIEQNGGINQSAGSAGPLRDRAKRTTRAHKYRRGIIGNPQIVIV